MIDLNGIGFNTICPICGKELDRVEFMADGRIGKYPFQTLTGYCPKCAFDVTISEGSSKSDPQMDILVEWNRVFKKKTRFITVDEIKAANDEYGPSNIDQFDIYGDEELTIEAEKYCKDLGIRIARIHEKRSDEYGGFLKGEEI